MEELTDDELSLISEALQYYSKMLRKVDHDHAHAGATQCDYLRDKIDEEGEERRRQAAEAVGIVWKGRKRDD